MAIYLLDKSLKVDVFYEKQDSDFTDNICISLLEIAPEEEQVFLYGETNLYITPDEARCLAQMLLEAADASQA
ncbi:MAG TPA: hypothetical protein VHO48_13445 [Anaerolineaceae bacterium]|nr:hypothetical protein [Anaerolineaceae bacterium]